MRNIICIFMIMFVTTAFANDQDEYCEGWELGYKTAIENNNVYVPYCPYSGYAEYGTTYFQKGLKDGMKKGFEDKN